jgi:hypothetical protein
MMISPDPIVFPYPDPPKKLSPKMHNSRQFDSEEDISSQADSQSEGSGKFQIYFDSLRILSSALDSVFPQKARSLFRGLNTFSSKEE